MKDLPPDPPIYTPPPERWFDRHEHKPGDTSRIALTTTLSAMWLTLHDRMRLPLPSNQRTFSVIDITMAESFIKRIGADMTMSMWRSACNYVDRQESPEIAFRNLLAAKGVNDE